MRNDEYIVNSKMDGWEDRYYLLLLNIDTMIVVYKVTTTFIKHYTGHLNIIQQDVLTGHGPIIIAIPRY